MAKRATKPAEVTEETTDLTAAEVLLKKYPVLENPNTLLLQNPSTGLATSVSRYVWDLSQKRRKSDKSPLAGCVIAYMTDKDGNITDASGNPV